MRIGSVRNRKLAIGSLALSFAALGGGGAAGASPARAVPGVYTVRVILSGTSLSHAYTPAGGSPATERLQDPDDITRLGNRIFVGFQNGVGPQGQASSDGNLDSTIVELDLHGDPVAQWDLQGKADGVTADPRTGQVIATVNEDADSSLYLIDPAASPSMQVQHYRYDQPLPHNGGTDAISVYGSEILISASAPGTSGAAAPQPNYPAVYEVDLDSRTRVASIEPLFYDEDQATVANLGAPDYGQSRSLALTDPDSNEVVPFGARFGGDFLLTSQGDQEQIYVSHPGSGHQRLSVLSLSQSVDDTVWPSTRFGTLYSTDSSNDSVDTVTGPFTAGQPMVVATPCGTNSAPATCPMPPAFPANFLASLNPTNGQVTAVTTAGAAYTPQGGLLFVPAPQGRSV